MRRHQFCCRGLLTLRRSLRTLGRSCSFWSPRTCGPGCASIHVPLQPHFLDRDLYALDLGGFAPRSTQSALAMRTVFWTTKSVPPASSLETVAWIAWLGLQRRHAAALRLSIDLVAKLVEVQSHACDVCIAIYLHHSQVAADNLLREKLRKDTEDRVVPTRPSFLRKDIFTIGAHLGSG